MQNKSTVFLNFFFSKWKKNTFFISIDNKNIHLDAFFA